MKALSVNNPYLILDDYKDILLPKVSDTAAHVHEDADSVSALRDESFSDSLRESSDAYQATTSLSRLINEKDRPGLMLYFTAAIVDLGCKIAKRSGLEADELIGEGLIGAMQHLSACHLRQSRLRVDVLSAAEAKMQALLLRVQPDQMRHESGSEALDAIGYDHHKEMVRDDALEHARARIDKSLERYDERDATVIRARYGFNGNEEWNLKDFAERYKISKARVSKIVVNAVKDWKIRGSTRLAKSLAELSEDRPMRDGPPRERVARYYDMLEQLRRELGLDLEAFRRRHGLAPHTIAAFLADLYPDLKTRSALRIVELSKEERVKAIFPDATNLRQYGDIEGLKRQIASLEHRREAVGRGAEVKL